jgi:uncharacterized membrane protein HdeD (DUF308 family)
VLVAAGIALAIPAGALLALMFLFAAYAALTGLLSIVAALSVVPVDSPPWILWVQAVVAFVAAAAIGWPAPSADVLVWVIAWWAMLYGALDIETARYMRRSMDGGSKLALAGLLSIAFGAVILLAPAAGPLALRVLIVAYAFVVGTLWIGLGLELRRSLRMLR